MKMLPIGRMLKRNLSLEDTSTQKQNSERSRNQRLYRSMGKSKEVGSKKDKRKGSPVLIKLKEDFMWMQSSPHVPTKPWKLRYIMLLEERLCYLKEQRDKFNFQVSKSAEWKSINISDVISLQTSVHGGSVTHITNNKSEDETTNTFCLKTAHSRYQFKCRNQEERDKWMAAILTAKSSILLKQK